jgi:hypothetical protein
MSDRESKPLPLRTEATWMRKKAERVEARGGTIVEISPAMARRIADWLDELDRLRGGGDAR